MSRINVVGLLGLVNPVFTKVTIQFVISQFLKPILQFTTFIMAGPITLSVEGIIAIIEGVLLFVLLIAFWWSRRGASKSRW